MAHSPTIKGFSVMTDIAADYREGWTQAPPLDVYRNPYRVGWEQFLRHVVADTPLVSNFAAGIRDVQFAEACERSKAERTWIALPQLAD
jgi:predicted dehydrogenase